MVNTQFSYSMNLLLMLCMTREGGTSHSLLYAGHIYPISFWHSPVAQVELSHLQGEENEPRYSASTTSSIRNITSHLYFFKALTFKMIRISDSQPRQRSESTTFTHTLRQCYNNDDDDDAAIY